MKLKELYPILECWRVRIVGNDYNQNNLHKVLYSLGDPYAAKRHIDFKVWMDCEVEEIDVNNKGDVDIVIDTSWAYLEDEPDHEETSPLKIVKIKLFPEKK